MYKYEKYLKRTSMKIRNLRACEKHFIEFNDKKKKFIIFPSYPNDDDFYEFLCKLTPSKG